MPVMVLGGSLSGHNPPRFRGIEDLPSKLRGAPVHICSLAESRFFSSVLNSIRSPFRRRVTFFIFSAFGQPAAILPLGLDAKMLFDRCWGAVSDSQGKVFCSM